MKRYNVPTGDICIMEGKKGKLEFLSLGDYGKEKNVKADFMNLKDDINGVPHGKLLPLTEKWVITISTQYGCSMNCSFCDVPNVGHGKNATYWDLINQVILAMILHPEISWSSRLNLHYARMGEPTFNRNVITSAHTFKSMLKPEFKFHPVVSTMMPKRNKKLYEFLKSWIELKNDFEGEAGLQLSINTTSDRYRLKIMPETMNLRDISNMLCDILQYMPDGLKGRKIALNFAITDQTEIDANKLNDLFSPKYFMCKITPMHLTESCVDNNLITHDGYSYFYPYKEHEKNLKKAGFDVLVFIPSIEEDQGRITCGNAILSGTRPKAYKTFTN